MPENKKKKKHEKIEKLPIKIVLTPKQDFGYLKGRVSLKFTLQTDHKADLEDFLECMIQAEKDVKKVLEDLKK